MMVPSVGKAILARGLQRLLFAIGGLCLGLALLGWAEAVAFQYMLDWRLERALREGAGRPAPSPPVSRMPPVATSGASVATSAPPVERPALRLPVEVEEPIGRIAAPRLAWSAVIAEGIGARTLRRAVGHIPGTALPGEPGNVGLAAHRDTFFWWLRDVRVGDHLRIVTPQGRFDYEVSATHVVAPERIDLLEPSSGPTLTLVTCYPFSFVGPAPERFVVSAEQVGGVSRASHDRFWILP